MGLIRKSYQAMHEIVTDQFLGVYAVEQMDAEVLAQRAGKRVWNRRGGVKEEMTNTITNISNSNGKGNVLTNINFSSVSNFSNV